MSEVLDRIANKGTTFDRKEAFLYPHPNEQFDEPGPIPEDEIDLYVHIPFCSQKCHYCSFAMVPTEQREMGTRMRRYVDAVIAEAQAFARRPHVPRIRRLYLGGGTPSNLTNDLLVYLVDGLRKTLLLEPLDEFTAEANPSDLDDAKLEAFRSIGVSRLSIGTQSFDDEILASMGRTYRGRDVVEVVGRARCHGFDNVNLDLICGYPGVDEKVWRTSIEAALSLRPERLTIYTLQVKDRTLLERERRQQRLVHQPETSELMEMMDGLFDSMEAKGYRATTMLGFTYDETGTFRLQRDMLQTGSILGFGQSAFSRMRESIFINDLRMPNYLQRIGETGAATIVGRMLDERMRMSMFAVGGLKLLGLDRELFAKTFGCLLEDVFDEPLGSLIEGGLLKEEPTAFVPTRQGMLYMGSMMEEFYIDGAAGGSEVQL